MDDFSQKVGTNQVDWNRSVVLIARRRSPERSSVILRTLRKSKHLGIEGGIR